MFRWKSFIILIALSSILWFGLMLTSAQNLTQQILMQAALATTEQLCSETGRDQACYGHSLVNALTQPDVQTFAFNEMGDIESVAKLQSLRLSDLTVESGLWGITLMKLRANLPSSVMDNVTLLAFGGVKIDAAEVTTSGVAAPMQAFYFQSDVETGSAAEVPTSGLLIQTPEGAGEVTFLMNEVNIQIGSTVYFEAAPGGEMIVSTLEGKARVNAHGVEQVAIAGTRVRVPMNENLGPDGPPSAPESYDADVLGNLPIGLMGRQIVVHPGLGNNTVVTTAGVGFQNSESLNDNGSDDAVPSGEDETGSENMCSDETSSEECADLSDVDGLITDNQGVPPEQYGAGDFGCDHPGVYCDIPADLPDAATDLPDVVGNPPGLDGNDKDKSDSKPPAADNASNKGKANNK